MTLIFCVCIHIYCYRIIICLIETQVQSVLWFWFTLWTIYLAVQVASKSLMDTLNEMYESQWVGHDHMCTDSNNLDMLWSDYTHKLADQVLIPLNTYQAQFAETRVSDYIKWKSIILRDAGCDKGDLYVLWVKVEREGPQIYCSMI